MLLLYMGSEQDTEILCTGGNVAQTKMTVKFNKMTYI